MFQTISANFNQPRLISNIEVCFKPPPPRIFNHYDELQTSQPAPSYFNHRSAFQPSHVYYNHRNHRSIFDHTTEYSGGHRRVFRTTVAVYSNQFNVLKPPPSIFRPSQRFKHRPSVFQEIAPYSNHIPGIAVIPSRISVYFTYRSMLRPTAAVYLDYLGVLKPPQVCFGHLTFFKNHVCVFQSSHRTSTIYGSDPKSACSVFQPSTCCDQPSQGINASYLNVAKTPQCIWIKPSQSIKNRLSVSQTSHRTSTTYRGDCKQYRCVFQSSQRISTAPAIQPSQRTPSCFNPQSAFQPPPWASTTLQCIPSIAAGVPSFHRSHMRTVPSSDRSTRVRTLARCAPASPNDDEDEARGHHRGGLSSFPCNLVP